MPWGDWQFWVVTLIALATLIPLARMLLPSKPQARGKRTTLTISAARAPDRVQSRHATDP